MTVFDEIKLGLTEAIEYENGTLEANTRTVSLSPIEKCEVKYCENMDNHATCELQESGTNAIARAVNEGGSEEEEGQTANYVPEDLRDIYLIAQSIDPGKALRLVREAKTEEEMHFFAYIHDMNLQRIQKRVILKNSLKENIVQTVTGSMALSGMDLTAEDRECIWLIANDSENVDERDP